MKPSEFEDLNARIQFLNEYLSNGGVEQIPFVDLRKDLQAIQFDRHQKVLPSSVSSRVRAFISCLVQEQLQPSTSLKEYQTFLQKEQYFEQTFVEDEVSFDLLFEKLNNDKTLVFRGQTEAAWRLFSTLQRAIQGKNIDKPTFKELLNCLIEKGKATFADEMHAALGEQHKDSLNNLAVLGFLQHHGCATPLLDWTYSLSNSLYFALYGANSSLNHKQISNYFSVYYLEEKELEKASVRKIIEDQLSKNNDLYLKRLIEQYVVGNKKTKNAAFKAFKGRKVIDARKISRNGLIGKLTNLDNLLNGLMEINYFGDKNEFNEITYSLRNSKNIKQQQGVFSWNASPWKPLELVGQEEFRKAKPDSKSDYRFCNCINIHKSLAPYILSMLQKSGIDYASIYPSSHLDAKPVFNACFKRNVD